MVQNPSRPGAEQVPLSQVAQHLLEECRMVLPGIQALFGFQLIAVFNDGFSEKLGPAQQYLHLGAIALVAAAMALVMAPAAYHRQTTPGTLTDHFIALSSRLLLLSMFPLALGIAADFYLIARIITRNEILAVGLAAVLLVLFFGLWLLLPRYAGRREGPTPPP